MKKKKKKTTTKKCANINNVVIKITDKESIKLTGKSLLKIYEESKKEKKEGEINIIFNKYKIMLVGKIKKIK